MKIRLRSLLEYRVENMFQIEDDSLRATVVSN